jgi:hypothetical protein
MARVPRRLLRRTRARAAWGLGALLLAPNVLAQAETTRLDLTWTPPPPPSKTFTYTQPAEAKPLRAAAEIGAVLAVGFAWYATTAPTVKRWDPGYRWATFKNKLTLKDFGTDSNEFGTNFVGHPAGGTGYYLAARANRLSIPVSFGLAVTGSLLWEMFGEVSEVVSMNDMIVTPLAGIAIGEATTQLGAYFDRQSSSGGHRILGSLFGPLKSLNDRLDGLSPDRSGLDEDEWHRFRADAALTLSQEDRAVGGNRRVWPEGSALLSSELVRLPGYDRTGEDMRWFSDGNVSNIALTASAGGAGLTDVAFSTQVVLAGGYYRSSRRDARGNAWGGNGLFGVTTGFVYAFHQYHREQPSKLDRVSTVQPLGFSFEQRGWLGETVVTGAVELGPDFGGMTPADITGFDGDPARLPLVQRQRGYYLGVGGHLRARLALAHGPAFLTGEVAGIGLRGISVPADPQGPRLEDELVTYGLELGARVPGSAFTPRLFAERRLRRGVVGDLPGRAGDSTLGAGMGATF